VLVLAPVRAAAGEVALGACSAALVGFRRFAFREFMLELSAAESNRCALIPDGRFVREALAARVTAAALDRGELAYLRPVAGCPGFPRALTATFEELRPQRRGSRSSARLRRIRNESGTATAI
jgi:hypothetical protein